MEEFCDSMKPHEEVLIQRYIDKCAVFHGTSIIIFYFSGIITCMTPIFTEATFPVYVDYPFDVYYQPMISIIYFHMCLVALFVVGQLCSNIFMAMLLWFAIARLEITNEELKKATNIYELYRCIKKHQELLE